MDIQIKIFYDSLYFEEIACEFAKSLAPLQSEFVYILDGAEEKKHWPKTVYFCFGLDRWLDLRNLPPKYVVMQTEPLCVRGLSENYLIICARSLAIFDYSRLNLGVYREYNIPKSKVRVMNIGSGDTPLKKNPAAKENPSPEEKDLDVIFIGKMTSYRASVLQALRIKYPSKTIQHYEDLWGADRDNIVSRAKVVLNIHTEKCSNFPLETPRLLYLSQFNVHILSEASGDRDEDNRWSARVNFGHGDLDVLGEILHTPHDAKSPFLKKLASHPPAFKHSVAEFLAKSMYRPVHLTSDIVKDLCKKKWFDTADSPFKTLDLRDPDVPDLSAFPDRSLPMVSITTLTTLDRIEKWADLMLWNNQHRIYPKEKLEWIIVVEKPVGSDAIKKFGAVRNRLSGGSLSPRFVYYENKHKETPFRITEKRNLALENCSYDIIDIMDDDDIEIPDALRVKVVLLDHYEQKGCVGSRSFMCLDTTNDTLFVKKANFPTESTLTFKRSFAAGVGFTPSIHGEGSLMVLSQCRAVIDIPSALNLIAITHKKNITGTSRTLKNTCDQETLNSESKENLQSSTYGIYLYLCQFIGKCAASQLMQILYGCYSLHEIQRPSPATCE